MFAQVIVSIPHQRLDRPFTYRVPQGMNAAVGSRVIVPFGSRRVHAYCVGLTDSAAVDADGIKDIESVLDDLPVLTPEMVELAEWGARRFLCRRFDLLQAMLPAGVQWSSDRWVGACASGDTGDAALSYLQKNGPIKLSKWVSLFPELKKRGSIKKMQENGHIAIARRDHQQGMRKKERAAFLSPAGYQAVGRGKKQLLALELLKEKKEMSLKELSEAGVSYAVLRSMHSRGWLEIRENEIRRDPLRGETFSVSPPPALTAAQACALDKISKASAQNQTETILLHGVTGSGKTEVYLRAIEEMVKIKKGSIVLVPEIALTPQMIERFVGRFGKMVAILHSRLSLGERYDEWRKVAEGETLIAVGARSAVFAPFRRLGLIVLDEEHEASYKQDEAPRYHARDVALWRAQKHNAVVLLGSATPSVESYHKAATGGYRICSLPQRVEGRDMPLVEIVDMRTELKEGHRSIFSRVLLRQLHKVQNDEKQAILLLNRRGYATFVLCRECGYVLRCRSCHVALKYHLREEKLRCHYCDYLAVYPNICPACGGRYIRHFGAGTQKVEEELLKHFPKLPVVRLDADTTTQKGSHQKILKSFQKKEARVLIGTQMVAKGLDFPEVTLVGVVSADTALNLPDFRAGEKTFQLLTQVAGRAGRGVNEGQVVIQTYTPEHYSVLAAKEHNYAGFITEELKCRQELGYPPFSYLIRLLLTGTDEGKVMDAAGFTASLLQDSAEVLGPSPCPLERIRGNFRWHLLVRGKELEPLLFAVNEAWTKYGQTALAAQVRLAADVEPQSLL